MLYSMEVRGESSYLKCLKTQKAKEPLAQIITDFNAFILYYVLVYSYDRSDY